MKLGALLLGLDATVPSGAESIDVTAATIDSRRVTPGALFIACAGATGTSHDGHAYVDAAVAAGARAVVVARGRSVNAPSVPVVAVDDPRAVAAVVAERLAGEPSRRLAVVGVTGTNGKTTVAFVTASLLDALGTPTAVLGTLGVGAPEALRPLGFTTPEAEILAPALASLVDDGFKAVVMEVSSHALATKRADGVRFKVGAFTNITQDHLDFHGSMDAYLAAKNRLFDALLPEDGVAVLPAARVVVDGASLSAGGGRRVVRWGVGAGDVAAHDVALTSSGIRFRLVGPDGAGVVESALIGAHNVENLIVAAAIAHALGHATPVVASALSSARGAPGRLERVTGSAVGPLVVVDYAHTPDALARVLEAVRGLGRGRVICVFGCGGDRDRGKRPRMGEAAARGADVVVLTSDNPRSEDPERILDEIEPGVVAVGLPRFVAGARQGWLREADRGKAIAAAIALAAMDDVVLLAGKGHETTMTAGGVVVPFDDREVARAILGGAP